MNNHAYIVVNELFSYGKLIDYHIITGFSNRSDAETYIKDVEYHCKKTDDLIKKEIEITHNKDLIKHNKQYSHKLHIVDVVLEP